MSVYHSNEFLITHARPRLFVNRKPVYGQTEKKIPCGEIYWIKAAQQVLPQLRRCHLALWPGLIWLGSACSLRSVCVCHRCLSRTCITPGKKQVESLTRHHLHLQVAICDVPFRVPACNRRLQYSAHWFKLSGVLFCFCFFGKRPHSGKWQRYTCAFWTTSNT